MKTIIKTFFYVVSACALSMPFSLSAKNVFDSKMEAVSNQLKAAVKSGKLSEEDAWAKWKAIQGDYQESKKGWDMEAIAKKLKAAVAAGKISESEARQKWEAIKDESDHLKDSGHDDGEINEEEELWEEVGRGLKAAIELARQWRSDRALRRLEALLIVADQASTLMLSGQGDVIEPTDGICAIGSGSTPALAAARALVGGTDLDAAEICRTSLDIAAAICVYTNHSITLETL